VKHVARWFSVLALAWPLTVSAQAPLPAGQAAPLPQGHPPVAGAAQAPPLPAGHPSVAGTPQAAAPLPAGHPSVGSAATAPLPAGHPPVADSAQPAPAASNAAPAQPTPEPQAADASAAANPHAANPHGGGLNAPRDTSNPDASVPKGGIVATIVDGKGQPIAGIQVRLGKMFQSIAQGERRDDETQVSNAQGEVRFSGLESSSNFSYRVTVTKGGAEYASTPFRLAEDRGQRVMLHVYPVTSDIDEARVMMRGLIWVEARDDTFQFEVWFQIYNIGDITWVPSDVEMELPEGAKAFSARESMTDARAEADGDTRVKLLGTFSPGQHDVRFNFQVDNPQEASVAFSLDLPPRVAEFRVVAAAAKGMTLTARDFPPVQVSVGPQGERVLVTQQRAQDRSIETVHFELAGLPTRGNAPWLAVLLAAATAATGLYVASQKPAPGRGRRKLTGDLKQARDVLLDELLQLEKAKVDGRLGPQSYEQTRRALVTALARIVQPG